MPHMTIIGIVPARQTFYAVLADEHGKPEFRLIVAMGTLEGKDNDGDSVRCVGAFGIGEHIDCVDFLPNFVGYSEHIAPLRWEGKCGAKRIAMAELERELKENMGKPQIIVPGKKKVTNPFN